MLKFISTLFTAFLLISGCNTNDIENYIVNGESVGVVGVNSEGQEIIKNIGEFPYIVSLNEEGEHVCGGVIIDENIVITAAHCVYDVDAKDLQVRAGILIITDEKKSTEQILDVEFITIHPYFKKIGNYNDIAILWLKGRFQFNKYVNKVQMSELIGDNYAGEKLTVIGWGSDKINYRTDNLKKAFLEVIAMDDCTKMLPEWLIPDSMICVVDKNHVQTTCSGDSGGPMIRHDPNNSRNDIFIGIKSAGFCNPKWPTLYADVGQLRSWVLDEMRRKKLGCYAYN